MHVWTVHEVSELTGISIRALQYYDKIGLLPPTQHTEAGYRLYDEAALARLQQILLFRELEFPLKDIGAILDSPGFDRGKALVQQIELLELKKEHLENLIDLAKGMRAMGVKPLMDFKAFDTRKIDEYAAQAKSSWEQTEAYKEYEQKSRGRSREEAQALGQQMMQIFADFGALRQQSPDSVAAQAQVRKLRDFISAHYYTCTDEMLERLGMMYTGGGELTANIDQAGGDGTAEFAHAAIRAFCER